MKSLLAAAGAVAVVMCCVSDRGSAGPGPEAKEQGLADLFPFVLTNGNAHAEEPRVPMLPGFKSGGQTNLFVGTNLFGLGTRRIAPFLAGTNGIINFSQGKPLSPGVYLSKPYACIVVVPEASADAQMVIKPKSGIDSKMPMIGPKVEFVPWPETGARVSSK